MQRILGVVLSAAMVGYAVKESDRRGGDYDDVTAISVAYFMLMLALFVRAARGSHGGRRTFAIFMVVASVGMAVFSAMLSGAISFDEVFPAWIAYAVIAAIFWLGHRAPASAPPAA